MGVSPASGFQLSTQRIRFFLAVRSCPRVVNGKLRVARRKAIGAAQYVDAVEQPIPFATESAEGFFSAIASLPGIVVALHEIKPAPPLHPLLDELHVEPQ